MNPYRIDALANSAQALIRLADDMAEWAKREHSKVLIDRTGEILVPWWKGLAKSDDLQNLGRSYIIVQNWRTSHAFPLNSFQNSLRRRAQRVEQNPLIAQRLKRFSSLMEKLVREPKMKLTQMQDLGGCRAIMSDVDGVYRLFDLYQGSLGSSEKKFKYYDYISNPKSDGYRSIHIVGRYSAKHPRHEPWNGQRIEIQLRSRLQHSFATAVETVTTFTRTRLKFGTGPAKWKRFFSLMGSALALREGTRLVAGTPEDETDLIGELRESATELKVRQLLGGWTNTLRSLPSHLHKDFKWLLLVLDVRDKRVEVTPFADRQEGQQALAKIEQLNRTDLDAVLVWVRSAKHLRAAYPNYYADTLEFLNALDQAIGTSRGAF